jgi:hypothetical protein
VGDQKGGRYVSGTVLTGGSKTCYLLFAIFNGRFVHGYGGFGHQVHRARRWLERQLVRPKLLNNLRDGVLDFTLQFVDDLVVHGFSFVEAGEADFVTGGTSSFDFRVAR